MKRGGLPDSYDDALDTDDNLIHQVKYAEATRAQAQQLVAEKDTIEALVKHHIGLGGARVIVNFQRCIIGSFNICFPVRVESRHKTLALFLRCAMPHKLAESRCPGTVDEKMSCEVATYAWMQQNCPDIRIPYLYGFGFTDDRHFTHEAQRSFCTRLVQLVRRALLRIWKPSSTTCTSYASHPSRHCLSTGSIVCKT